MVLLDAGAGVGRPLFTAAGLGGLDIVGIELDSAKVLKMQALW